MLRATRVGSSCLAFLVCVFSLTAAFAADTTGSHSARPIITSDVQGSKLTALRAPQITELKTATDLGRLSADRELDLRLVMKPAPEEQAALNAFVEQTRTPGDPKYGQTLTPAEFIESFGLAQSDVAKLQAWLESAGFQNVKVHGDVISFRGAAGQAEQVFATEIHNYTLANGTERFAYATAPKVPTAFAAAIWRIDGLQNVFAIPATPYPGPVAIPQTGHDTPTPAFAAQHEAINQGWTSPLAGNPQLESMREGEAERANPDIYQITTTTVTVSPITGTKPTVANGQTGIVTAVLTWTAAGTPTGTMTLSDSDGALSVSINLPACTKTNATTYTCTYNWTAATGAFHTPDTITAHYGGDTGFAVSSASTTSTLTLDGDYDEFYTFTGSEYTWPQGTSPNVTLTFDLEGDFDAPTGNVMFWGTGLIDQIHEFTSIQTGSVCSSSDFEGTVTCKDVWNPSNTLAAGTYSVYATYSGDSINASSSAIAMSQFTITATGTTANTTTVTADPATVQGAGGTTFTTTTTWTGSGAAPTGSIGIYQAGGYGYGAAVFPTAPATTSSGSGTYFYGEYTYSYSCTTTTSAKTVVCQITASDVGTNLLNAGANTLTATYSGDTVYKASSGNVTVTYGDGDNFTPTLSITASPQYAGAGSSITYTATLVGVAGEGQPAGTITFSGTALGASFVDSAAAGCTSTGTGGNKVYTCIVTQVAPVPATARFGTYPAMASYSGSTIYTGVDATVDVYISGPILTTSTVTAAPTAVSGGVPSTTITDVISWTTAQTVQPTGTVTLTCGTGSAGTCTNLPAPINVSSCTTVSTTSISCSISYALDTYDNAYGNYNMTMAYSGDDNYRYSSGVAVVDDEDIGTDVSTTTVTASPTSVVYGAGTSVTYTAKVKGTANDGQPAGSVTFSGTPIGASSVNVTITAAMCASAGTGVNKVYTCTVPTSAIPVPVATLANTTGYTITAAYGGSSNYVSSTGTTLLPVTLATPTVTVHSFTDYYGDTVTLGATETGVTGGAEPSGASTFKVNGVTITGTPTCTNDAPPAVDQVCTLSYQLPASLVAGSYGMSVAFAADSNYAAATGTGTLTVDANATATAVSASPTSLTAAQTTTLTATVTNTSIVSGAVPTGGTVTFTDTTNSAALGSCTLSAGTCSVTANGSALVGGTNNVQASYGGVTAEFLASSSTTIVTLNGGAVCTGNDLCFTSVSHDFGQVQVGTAAAAYGIGVSNNSTTTAYAFTLNFTPSNGFTEQNNCPASIAAGGTCEIVFYFTPTTTGPTSTTWSVTAENGFSYAPYQGGTLSGSGTTGAGVSLTTNGHDFGTVTTGTTSSTYSTELSNSTTTAETISLGTVSAPFYMMTNCGATLAAGSSCEIQFTYSPASNSPASVVVPLSGSPTTITSGGAVLPNGGITLTGN